MFRDLYPSETEKKSLKVMILLLRFHGEEN